MITGLAVTAVPMFLPMPIASDAEHGPDRNFPSAPGMPI